MITPEILEEAKTNPKVALLVKLYPHLNDLVERIYTKIQPQLDKIGVRLDAISSELSGINGNINEAVEPFHYLVLLATMIQLPKGCFL
jgi:hypothetical protein